MSNEISLSRARPVLLAALAALVPAVLILAAGCTQEPTAPAYENPLDPDGPYQGDPFQVDAGYTDTGVLVSWNGLTLSGIAAYEVLHSLEADGPFTIAGSVEYPTKTYLHTEYASNQDNYYKVRAVDASGVGTAITPVQAALVPVPPYLEFGETETAASRKLDLFIRVDMGDSIELGATPDFELGLVHEFDDNGEVTVPWDLGAADSSGVMKRVYMRVFTGGAAGQTWEDSIEVDFDPQLTLKNGETFVASMNTLFEISGDGVTQMRFAADLRDLPSAPWLTGDAQYDGYLLDAAPDSQTVYGEFMCDFGFTRVDSALAVPDSLANIVLTINGGAESTPDLEFSMQTSVAASQMRFAESVAELASTAWQDYATTGYFAHSACVGDLVKTVHGQFRNDWFDPDPVSATIQWLPAEVLDVTIAVADTVTGGTPVQVTGTAVAGTCGDPLDAVEFNDGGGWIIADGLEAWSYDWTPPTVVEHTPLTLRARALAGAEADTVEVEVIVAPD